MERASRARLPDALFALKADAVNGGGNLGNQVADAANRATVPGKVGQAMPIAQLLAQPIVVGHQPAAFGRRE